LPICRGWVLNSTQFDCQDGFRIFGLLLEPRHDKRNKKLCGDQVEFADRFETKGFHSGNPTFV
jgi:hypothetical protein